MKIHTEHNEVLTSSNNQTGFTINASAHAFRILSDGLYQHKIAAIIRELSCNAYDSHVDAGKKDVPFRVVLPNALHPYFEIEDFGVGLDDDDVRTVYTSYFTSTKTDSNDMVGAFGLGSKTPFAYTDSFDIQARKDGIERVYSAYIGEDGAPCVNLIVQKFTPESNGVKITVPVKHSDYQEFSKEASYILSFFITKPIVALDGFEFFLPTIADELEFGIATARYAYSPSRLYTGRVFIVMGGVCYPYNEYLLVEDLPHKEKSYYNNVLNRGYGTVVFIRYDIGDLEVAASRESLSINERTKAKLVETLTEKVQLLIEQDSVEIDQCEHPIAALEYVENKYSLGNLAHGTFSYKGTSFTKIANRSIGKVFPTKKDMMMFSATRTSGGFIRAERENNKHLSMSKLRLKNITGFYINEGQKTTGMITESRRMIKQMNDVCFAFNKPLSIQERKRIEQITGKEINWLNLQEYRKEQKKLNPRVSGGGKTTRTLLENHEVSSPSIKAFRNSSAVKYNQSSHDLSDVHTTFYYYDGNVSDIFVIPMTFNGIYASVTIYELPYIASMLDEDIVIVNRNGRTERKLNESGVQDIKTAIDRASKIVKDYVMVRDMKSIITDTYAECMFSIKKDGVGFRDNGLRFLDKNNPEFLENELKMIGDVLSSYDVSDESIREIVGNSLIDGLSRYTLLQNDAEIGKNNNVTTVLYKQILENVSEKYPLIAKTFWGVDVDQDTLLLDYIKMVDKLG